MLSKKSLVLGFILALSCVTGRGMQSPLTDVPPNPQLVAYASANAISLRGWETCASALNPRKGDEVVFLFSLQQPAGFRQWLVRLIADDLTPQEVAKKRDSNRMFTSTGLELEYTHTPAALDVEFIGPFDPVGGASPVVIVNKSRALASAESLSLGIDPYCRSSIEITRRLKTAGLVKPIYYGGDKRPSESAIAKGKAAAAAFQLTPEEERLAFSVYFSLTAFYSVANEIPACRSVLEQVLQKPSAWSVARNLGVGTNFQYGWQDVQKLPEPADGTRAAQFILPARLSLNDEPAVIALLAVTDTQPPLRNCAGIAAIHFEHPTDKNKHLFVRLLSARTAGSP